MYENVADIHTHTHIRKFQAGRFTYAVNNNQLKYRFTSDRIVQNAKFRTKKPKNQGHQRFSPAKNKC